MQYFKSRRAIKEFENLIESKKNKSIYNSTWKMDVLRVVEKYYGRDSLEFKTFAGWVPYTLVDGDDEIRASLDRKETVADNFIQSCISDIKFNGLKKIHVPVKQQKKSWATRHPFYSGLVLIIISLLLGYYLEDIIQLIRQYTDRQDSLK